MCHVRGQSLIWIKVKSPSVYNVGCFGTGVVLVLVVKAGDSNMLTPQLTWTQIMGFSIGVRRRKGNMLSSGQPIADRKKKESIY